MLKQTLREWRKEGENKFGEDINQWKFKCPACGHISKVADFIEAGATIDDAYQSCIGRHNGEGVDALKDKDRGQGCNWAAFGLFGVLDKGRTVTTPDGKEVQVFNFA